MARTTAKSSSGSTGGGGGAAAAHPPQGRPVAVTILYSSAFIGLAYFGYWYTQVFQKVEPFRPDFVALFEKSELPPGTIPASAGLSTAEYEKAMKLKREWTGHKGTDDLLSMLVLFFSAGTYGGDEKWGWVMKTQQSQLLMQLVSVLCLQLVEGFRSRNRWTLLSFPTIWAFFYQTMGGMFIFPVWYTIHTLLSSRASYHTGYTQLVPLNFARALFPCMLFLYILPTIAMYIPYTDPTWNQYATAFWQPSPAYVNICLWILGFTIFSSSSPSSAENAGSYKRSLFRVYGLAVIVGLAMQIHLIYTILNSQFSPFETLRLIFIPRLDLPQVSAAVGTMRMFQWDYLGIFGSTILWALLGVYDVQVRLLGADAGGVVKASMALLGGVVVLGPGAALALFGLWREGKIHKRVQREMGRKMQ